MSAQPPVELHQLRRWLEQVFEQAGRGLPLPEQLALRLIEQMLAVGMVGAALVEAWRLQALHRALGGGHEAARIDGIARALEAMAFGPLAPIVSQAWSSFESLGGAFGLAAPAAHHPSEERQARRPSPAGTPMVVR